MFMIMLAYAGTSNLSVFSMTMRLPWRGDFWQVYPWSLSEEQKPLGLWQSSLPRSFCFQSDKESAEKDFLPHLLNLRCLQLKIIFFPSLEFQGGAQKTIEVRFCCTVLECHLYLSVHSSCSLYYSKLRGFPPNRLKPLENGDTIVQDSGPAHKRHLIRICGMNQPNANTLGGEDRVTREQHTFNINFT